MARTLPIDFSIATDYCGGMLFYPFWTLLAGACTVYAVALRTKHQGMTLLVSLLFLASALSVLLAFLRFSQTVTIAFGQGLFLFEVERESILACVVTLLLISVSALFYIPRMRESDLAQGSAALLLASLCAVGSILAANPPAFAVLLGGIPVLALMLARLDQTVRCSPYVYLLYFVPCVMLLMFAAFAPNRAFSSGLELTSNAAATMLALVLATYLLLWPFGLPAVRILLSGTTETSLTVSLVVATALFCLVKFLPLGVPVKWITAVLGQVSALVWAFICYRRKDLISAVRTGYLAQTSAVTVMIVCALMNETLPKGGWFLLLANHLVSGLGVLLCISVGEEPQGKFVRGFFIFFLFSFLGLPPSPGFFERFLLLSSWLGRHDLFAYLLKLSFVVNLFLVYHLSKSLSLFWRRTAGSRTGPQTVLWPLSILAACIILSTLFLPHLRAYLGGSGR